MTEIEHRHASQLAVERFLQGEMAEDERLRFERAAKACEICKGRLDETRADDRAFALRPVPDYVRADMESTPAAMSSRTNTRALFRPWFVGIPVAAAAAFAAFLLWPGQVAHRGGEVAELGHRGGDDVVRLKGGGPSTGMSLGFYVSPRGGGEARVGKPGEALVSGDRIQFFYDAPTTSPFALVGLDGRGAVTTYFSTAASGAALAGGRGLTLGAAIELDDSVGAERFFLCAGEGARDIAAVERAAKALSAFSVELEEADRLPFACEQSSVWIRKE